MHHPPSDTHPNGKQVLLRETSVLGDRIAAHLPHHRRRHAEITQAHQDKIDFKIRDQADRGVPPEKSPI